MVYPYSQVAGENIEFVAREAFDEVQSAIEDGISSIVSKSEEKQPAVVFVYGASGSGKTRIGWHAYKTLGQPPMRPALAGYMCIGMRSLRKVHKKIMRSGSWTTMPQTEDEIEARKEADTAAASRALERLLLKKNQTSKLSRDEVPLHQLLAEWATAIRAQAKQKDAARLTVCLIVHVDEFQMRPWASACLVRAIRDANETLEGELNVCVLPVLTGLTTDETERYLKRDVVSGVDTHEIHVQYFAPRSSAAMQVSINAYSADFAAHLTHRGALRSPALTPGHFQTIPQLRLLFEDAGGWTLGLVRLGAATARQVEVEGTIRKVNWSTVEQETCKALFKAYKASEAQLGEGLGFSASGWPKLLLLVMAPFAVRGAAPSFCAALFCFVVVVLCLGVLCSGAGTCARI